MRFLDNMIRSRLCEAWIVQAQKLSNARTHGNSRRNMLDAKGKRDSIGPLSLLQYHTGSLGGMSFIGTPRNLAERQMWHSRSLLHASLAVQRDESEYKGRRRDLDGAPN